MDVYPELQEIRAKAVADHEPQPYLYDHYNPSAWYLSQVSTLKPMVVYFCNAFIKAMNEEKLLHKYVIMIMDKDVLNLLPTYKFGVKQVLRKELAWLIRQITRNLESRHDNLNTVRTGSLLPEYTKIFWVKMLAQPMSHNPDLIKILKLRCKLNETLEELLLKESNMHIITLSSVVEDNRFTLEGDLTKSGRIQFWAEVNYHLKRFDFKEDDLLPKKFRGSDQSTRNFGMAHCRCDRYHWHDRSSDGDRFSPSQQPQQRQMPTPPPRHPDAK